MNYGKIKKRRNIKAKKKNYLLLKSKLDKKHLTLKTKRKKINYS